MILADKIIMLRKRNGWSQEELAEQLNVTRQSVSKWEGAQSVPELDKILLMGKIFGVTTDYLLKDELEEPDYTPVTEPPQDTRRVTLQEANAYLAQRKKAAPRIAAAVAMYILSPICLLMLAAESEYGTTLNISEAVAGGVGMSALLVIVALATALLMTLYSDSKRYEYLEKEVFETEYGVAGMAEEQRSRYGRRYQVINIIGVCLCILSAAVLFIGAAISEEDFFMIAMLCGMMAIAAVGAALCVYAGVNGAALEKLLQDGDYSPEKKQGRGSIVTKVYWMVVVAVFLVWTFLINEETGWVVWPVAAVLFVAVKAIEKAVRK